MNKNLLNYGGLVIRKSSAWCCFLRSPTGGARLCGKPSGGSNAGNTRSLRASCSRVPPPACSRRRLQKRRCKRPSSVPDANRDGQLSAQEARQLPVTLQALRRSTATAAASCRRAEFDKGAQQQLQAYAAALPDHAAAPSSSCGKGKLGPSIVQVNSRLAAAGMLRPVFDQAALRSTHPPSHFPAPHQALAPRGQGDSHPAAADPSMVLDGAKQGLAGIADRRGRKHPRGHAPPSSAHCRSAPRHAPGKPA